MNHGDAVLQCLPWRAQVHRIAPQAQLSGIRGVNPRDDLHQGRLAGAVFADEGVHRTALDPKGDVVQCHDSGERLAEVADLQEAAIGHVGGQAVHGQCLPRYCVRFPGVTSSNGTHTKLGTFSPLTSFSAVSTAPVPWAGAFWNTVALRSPAFIAASASGVASIPATIVRDSSFACFRDWMAPMAISSSLARTASRVIVGVASVSTGLTMMASTLCAMKFWIWLSCLPMSFWASSNWIGTLSCCARSFMLARTAVRKLSSNKAMETPSVAACGAADSAGSTPASNARPMRFIPASLPEV